MAGLLETVVSNVIFNSLVPVPVTSQIELHVYLFPLAVSMVTLLHFLYFPAENHKCTINLVSYAVQLMQENNNAWRQHSS